MSAPQDESPKAVLCVVGGTFGLLAIATLLWLLYGAGAAALALLAALILAGSLLAAEHYSEERERRIYAAHVALTIGRAYDAGYAAAKREVRA